jgi:DNA-binding MarR family transcriptional regulator
MTRSEQSVSKSAVGETDARLAWQLLLQVSSRVLAEFDRRLDLDHRVSVREFDVLITLDNAPESRLRMTDLANAVLLSSGGLTRLVGRLEDRGFVRREPDTTDARGYHASLTGAGRERLAEARLTHDAVIDEFLGACLSSRDVATLTRILARVLGPDSPT